MPLHKTCLILSALVLSGFPKVTQSNAGNASIVYTTGVRKIATRLVKQISVLTSKAKDAPTDKGTDEPALLTSSATAVVIGVSFAFHLCIPTG